MLTEADLELSDGRTLHTYDTGAIGGEDGLVVFWHHGTPILGAPPEPLFPTSARLGVRWLSYDRPGYGGSTPDPDRTVDSAAGYAARIADELGIGQFAVMGHSGGAPHALACAALLPDRVLGAVSIAGLAPYDAEGLDWYEGIGTSGADALRAAAEGRAAKEQFEAAGADYDPEFTTADLALLAGDWAWLDNQGKAGMAGGPGGLIDDDLAYVAPWGFDPAAVVAPLLLLHGGRDRVVPVSHSEWLERHCRSAQLRFSPDDGHVSILSSAADSLEWLHASAMSNPARR